MKERFWDNSEIIDSEGTLMLQVSGSDVMRCSLVYSKDAGHDERMSKCADCGNAEEDHPVDGCDAFTKIEILTDERHQDWVNLIAVAPQMLTLLQAAQKALLMHQGHSVKDVLGDFPHLPSMEVYTANVEDEIGRLIYGLENNEIQTAQGLSLCVDVTAKKTEIPANWFQYHHPDCGTTYRGCHPTNCPKDHYEQTGEWKPDLAKKS